MNHPNAKLGPCSTPTSSEIKELREKVGMTQQQAANSICSTLRAWQQWEANERRMHPAFFNLFKKIIGLNL